MPPSSSDRPPRNYYLNEAHELLPGKPDGGGQFRPFRVDWGVRSVNLVSEFRAVLTTAQSKLDPTRAERYFVVTLPDAALTRESTGQDAVDGAVPVPASFDSDDAVRGLQRLGFDLLQVHEDGAAVVHASSETVKQLSATALLLEELSDRERAPWARLSAVRSVDRSRKVDEAFLRRLSRQAGEAVVVMHRVLTDLEAARLGEAFKSVVARHGGRILAGGRDFLGATWLKLVMDRSLAEIVADSFDSIRLIHPPVIGRLAAPEVSAHWPAGERHSGQTPSVEGLPVVGLVDSGVDEGHAFLGPTVVRTIGGRVVGGHGTAVASKIVWGELDDWPAHVRPPPECGIVDVRVADVAGRVDPHAVVDGMNAAALTGLARVFNLSLGFDASWTHPPDEQRLREGLLRYTAALDEFAFRRDALLVVAAGNAIEADRPTKAYPRHFDDPSWGLTFWSCGVNTLVCGAWAEGSHEAGLARDGEPSPFSRIGPGVANAPQPMFSAPGGNWNKDWRFESALGVGVASAGSWQWRRAWGTSFSTPLVARQAATALHAFARFCPEGASVSAGLAKAYLAWSASRPHIRPAAERLAKRTLGRGLPSVGRLREPQDDGALLFWQGEIPSERVATRVRIPIPQAWVRAASEPRLRLVAAWNTPVQDASQRQWICREVSLKLSATVEGPALRSKANRVGHLPLVDRLYDLSSLRDTATGDADADVCILSVSYRTLLEPVVPPPPEQRLGVVLELFDASPQPVPPHGALVDWEARVGVPMQQLARIGVAAPVRIPIPRA